MNVNLRIFAYNDGKSDVFGDPTDIDFELDRLGVEETLRMQRFLDMPKTPEGMIDFRAADKDDVRLRFDTYHELEPAIREAFRLEPFDRATGTGLLFGEVLELYSRYMDWRATVKKNMTQPLDSTPATA